VAAVNRVVRCLTAVLLLSSPLVLAGCSAGQVTQTGAQDRDRSGGTGRAGDVSVHAVQLAHPPGGVHEVGDEVEVTMAIVNRGLVDDRLVEVTGADFGAATPGGSPATADTAPGTTSGPDPAGTLTLSAQSPAAERTAVDVLVPARGSVLLGTGDAAVVLTGLTRRLDAAQSVELTLTFAEAGRVTVPAIVGPPPGLLPRGPAFDFHDHGAGEPVDARP
jgi:copper(I)-binding protein